jgi:hypothetical protein
VVVITRDLLKDELSEAALLLSRKAQKIEQGNLIKVQGDWCKGCPVTDCQFMEPPRWDGNVYTVSLQGSEEFIKNVSSVTAKILEILEKEFIQIAYAQETEYVHKS